MVFPFNHIFDFCLIIVLAVTVFPFGYVLLPHIKRRIKALPTSVLHGLDWFGERMITCVRNRRPIIPTVIVICFSLFLLVVSKSECVVDMIIVVVGVLAFLVGTNQVMPNGGDKVPRRVRNLAFVTSLFVVSAAAAYLIYLLFVEHSAEPLIQPLHEWISGIDKGDLQTIVLSLYTFGLLCFTALQISNEKSETIEQRRG